jgi:hypothetical protein
MDIFLTEIGEVNNVGVVLVPPFTAIPSLGEALKASKKSQAVWLGAQNMHWEKCGAFTGEISATMLRPVGIGPQVRAQDRAGRTRENARRLEPSARALESVVSLSITIEAAQLTNEK